MRQQIDRFYRSLDRSLKFRSRFVLGALVIPLALAFSAPLWTISMQAPQYPEGLELQIFAYSVGGDVAEVNTLNHYIGMQTIDRASLADLDWIPFAIGLLMLFILRVAAIGDVRSLVDAFALFLYFSLFSMARFAYRLYVFGHDLDPKAPFKVEPFTPAILGTKEIANFTITSLPGGATAWVGIFGIGLTLVMIWNLRSSWQRTPIQSG